MTAEEENCVGPAGSLRAAACDRVLVIMKLDRLGRSIRDSDQETLQPCLASS
jgi:hypothetical protein